MNEEQVGHLLNSLPQAPLLRAVGEEAARLGIEAYAVGGVVRDMLRQAPTQDVDLVTLGIGSGIRLARAVGKHLGGLTAHVYDQFGTAALRIRQDDGDVAELEFVAARKESYRASSRKPSVQAATLYEDLLRRDFTVNAMAVSVMPDRYGVLLDPFGGRRHLEKQWLITPRPPRRTFADDPLRMIRAARFAAQLNFTIDERLMHAMRQEAHRLSILSQERITEELEKIMASRLASYGFELIDQGGMLSRILPEVTALKGAQTIAGQRHKDNFHHTLKVLDNLVLATGDEENPPARSYWLRWAALLHDVGKPAAKRFVPGTGWTFHGHEDRGARMVPGIFQRLKLPLDDRMQYVRRLVALHHRPVALVDDMVTDSAVRRLLFDAGPDIDELMMLVRADITSRNPRRVARYLRAFDRVEDKFAEVEAKDHLRNFRPPIDGKEIMERVGIREGVAVGLIKDAIQEAILDGDIPNEREAALALLTEVKGDAVRRAALYEETVLTLPRSERQTSLAVKQAVLYGPLPPGREAALTYVHAVRNKAEQEAQNRLPASEVTSAAHPR